MKKTTVLILVKDKALEEELVFSFLHAEINQVHPVHNPDQLQQHIDMQRPDAVICESSAFPQVFELLIQESGETLKKMCLVSVSHQSESKSKIHALDMGADAAFIDPLNTDEIVAQTKSLIRRVDLVNHSQKAFAIKDLNINLDTHEVRKNGKLVDLTYTQFKLLYLFASQSENVFSRNDILSKVWGENAFVTNR
ncbi:response regulator transcription factor, partial [candidate division KSB1 bacterium]|nr:response regulator transcription factor [candidate division KSB1 bacterium]